MAENQIKDKLEQVMAAETNSLLAKAEYVFATCKAIPTWAYFALVCAEACARKTLKWRYGQNLRHSHEQQP